ncbi:hypothetical protein BofuT4_uP042890.1 [Botrytis cinerea T4]|uniref:Uncharacterized protein n=1 Tax=Botryotinia fuckeliana (strain T4) TaxID=999810 RepID=G2Y1Y8_BOTF4|nr:hypothetical protein BofuT4_uP042890.1 [Botrytis cinerea T4]
MSRTNQLLKPPATGRSPMTRDWIAANPESTNETRKSVLGIPTRTCVRLE